jgi:predicted phosphodiesterase
MKHAVVSDVHANLEALEAVLADAKTRGADDMVCLGDFVGYGASPNECVDRLKPLIELAVLGNHDQAVFDPTWLENFNEEAATAARWTATVLRRDHLDYLRALPYSLPWKGARLVHASPADPEAWNYVFTPHEAVMELDACAEPVCLVGHSHYPGTFEVQGRHAAYTRDKKILGRRDRRYLIVVPSVGQPRDGDPRAGYLMWDDEAWTFEHVRLEYDLEAAIRRIDAAELPHSLGERLRWGE